MENNLSQNTYNPDVLSCIANLSNDEVFTPPELANKMIDMLPQELFENPDTTFLDPCCKSGVFLREIAKRLIRGLEPQMPDLEKRVEHIFSKQLYGIAITELTSLLSRRSLYCSKFPSSGWSAYQFPESKPQGNVIYQRIQHTWKEGKCLYCGASQSEYDRGEELETHAYQFIHNFDVKKLCNMKFDVIIGNPPYQLSDGGNGASAKPLYHYFVEQAKKLNPQYLVMIIPARWYSGGKGLDGFRKNMLNDKHISNLVDFNNSSDCFPGVNIAGGVCYFLWDKSYKGKCQIVNIKGNKETSKMIRSLNEYPMFIRDNLSVEIIQKVLGLSSKTMDKVVKSRNSFSLPSNFKGSKEKSSNLISMLSSGGVQYISKDDIVDKDDILEKYKVVITYAMSGGNKPSSEGDYQIVSSLKVLNPNEVCTETFLVLDVFDNGDEAENLVSYVKTKFFRFLLLQTLTSIHITKNSFCFVPVLDCLKEWTDEKLYAKYNLTEEEVAFIESMIRPME
jgi:site-specific DNA-methyltransferase (adenine-specific)